MLNVKTIKAITTHSRANTKTASLMAIVLDGFIADGVSLEFFKSPKKDTSDKVHVAFFGELNSAIVASFTATDRKLLTLPVKALSDDQKKQRRYTQQQIGARRNDYQRALNKRLNPTPAKGADDKKTNDLTFCLERVTQMLKRLEKAESTTFDVVEAVQKLAQLNKVLNTKV